MQLSGVLGQYYLCPGWGVTWIRIYGSYKNGLQSTVKIWGQCTVVQASGAQCRAEQQEDNWSCRCPKLEPAEEDRASLLHSTTLNSTYCTDINFTTLNYTSLQYTFLRCLNFSDFFVSYQHVQHQHTPCSDCQHFADPPNHLCLCFSAVAPPSLFVSWHN